MRKMRFPYVALLIVTAAAMLLTACAPAATVAPTQPPAPTQAPASTQPPAATATTAPKPTPPPAKCDLMANPPTVKAGDLGSADNPITIAFVPSGDTGKITKAGTAITDCLDKMTGLSFKIVVGTSFGAAIEAMGAGKAQVGFLNTFSVLLAEAKYQIVPGLAVLRKYNSNSIDSDNPLSGKLSAFYKGQFIASVASGIKTFADLKGKKFCFVDPNSTSGYIVPRIVLMAQGVDPDKDFAAVINAGSHDKVGVAVYNGDCDAGVTYIDVLSDATANLKGKFPDISDKVKAFADTDRIPNDGVQFIKGFDPAIQAAITNSLLAMAEDPGGNAVISGLYTINGFQKIEASFYDDFAKVLKAAGVDPATLVK